MSQHGYTFTQKIDKDFIYSDIYEKIMFSHLPDDANMYDLCTTKNFKERNRVVWLGAWRWFSLYQYRDIISMYIFSDMKGVDFGGGGGPVAPNVPICDIRKKDRFDRPIEFENGKLPENTFDYIFTNHTLEHIQNVEDAVNMFYNSLKEDGIIIIILPYITCKRWEAKNGNSHIWNMYLSIDKNSHYYSEMKRFIEIDTLLYNKNFRLLKSEYCWDNSMFILGIKR